VSGRDRSWGITGATAVENMSPSCSAVLYLDICVGRTSADGMEKSQYRENVFWRAVRACT
jgi:hypothetical protein